jgi:hypothetical protein
VISSGPGVQFGSGAFTDRATPLRGLDSSYPTPPQELVARWSPQQISAVPRRFPDRPEMQVSHETIYRASCIQGRGELRRELHRWLRTVHALRRTRSRQ